MGFIMLLSVVGTWNGRTDIDRYGAYSVAQTVLCPTRRVEACSVAYTVSGHHLKQQHTVSRTQYRDQQSMQKHTMLRT